MLSLGIELNIRNERLDRVKKYNNKTKKNYNWSKMLSYFGHKLKISEDFSKQKRFTTC
jgi:hypothetical protein